MLEGSCVNLGFDAFSRSLVCSKRLRSSQPLSFLVRLLCICRRWAMRQAAPNSAAPSSFSQTKTPVAWRPYLHLFTCVFSNASLNETETWMAELESSVQVPHLWDLFFQLMCHPVPQVLLCAEEGFAASLVNRWHEDSRICAHDLLPTFVRVSGQASQIPFGWKCTRSSMPACRRNSRLLWTMRCAPLPRHPWICGPPLLDRLLRSVVVQPRSLQEASSLTRADITYQLNEIEVGRAACSDFHVCLPSLLPANPHACFKCLLPA